MPFRTSRKPVRSGAYLFRAVGASLILLIPSALGYSPPQRFARLGDFALENGSVITHAVVGYRTMGQLNADRSNAVLVIPWFQGTSGQLTRQIGPGKLVDSSRYFVILADPFGNGVSSSPSNSDLQPGRSFPEFSIADIVESHYQLVTRVLGISHLHAVVGVSMGGMQVFQWLVAHSRFVGKGVSIVGSPQAQPDDRERCLGIVRASQEPTWPRIQNAFVQMKPGILLTEIRRRPEDQIRQAEAMAALDISRRFDGSMERAAAAVRAQVMVAATWQDREVNPAPGFAFARMVGAETLELDGRCGHQAPSCDRATLWAAVSRFLAQ